MCSPWNFWEADRKAEAVVNYSDNVHWSASCCCHEIAKAYKEINKSKD